MLKKEKLSDKLVDIYSTKIIHNELKSGELIVETHISKKWGVSRSPVRDAIHILEKKKLIQRKKNGKYCVAELTESCLGDYIDVANLFYQYVFIKASSKISQNDLNKIQSLIVATEKSVTEKDYHSFISSVNSFETKLLKVANNRFIKNFTDELKFFKDRMLFLSISDSPEHLDDALSWLKKTYEHLAAKEPQRATLSYQNFLKVLIGIVQD